ncbi:hypothetical protein ACFPAF_17435 [Hymenobacter endophyticus]
MLLAGLLAFARERNFRHENYAERRPPNTAGLASASRGCKGSPVERTRP